MVQIMPKTPNDHFMQPLVKPALRFNAIIALIIKQGASITSPNVSVKQKAEKRQPIYKGTVREQSEPSHFVLIAAFF